VTSEPRPLPGRDQPRPVDQSRQERGQTRANVVIGDKQSVGLANARLELHHHGRRARREDIAVEMRDVAQVGDFENRAGREQLLSRT